MFFKRVCMRVCMKLLKFDALCLVRIIRFCSLHQLGGNNEHEILSSCPLQHTVLCQLRFGQVVIAFPLGKQSVSRHMRWRDQW